MHAERHLLSICVPSLVLIAQAAFLLEGGKTNRQTDKHTDATERCTHASDYTAGVVITYMYLPALRRVLSWKS